MHSDLESHGDGLRRPDLVGGFSEGQFPPWFDWGKDRGKRGGVEVKSERRRRERGIAVFGKIRTYFT